MHLTCYKISDHWILYVESKICIRLHIINPFFRAVVTLKNPLLIYRTVWKREIECFEMIAHYTFKVRCKVSCLIYSLKFHYL